MGFNYIFLDEEFLKHLSESKREKVINEMYSMYLFSLSKNSNAVSKMRYLESLKRVKVKAFYTFCPFCKNNYMIGLFGTLNDMSDSSYCVLCGESNIYNKAMNGLNKVSNLINVTNKLSGLTDQNTINDLNQQIVVLIISTLEVYLRDYYKTYLNMKIIKSGHSEIERFEKDSKNDFMNIDKANERFKKELYIDLKEIIGNKRYNDMKELSAYRNIIVHNNGQCDKKFIRLSIGKYEEQESVIIDVEMLMRYKKTVEDIIVHTGKIYEEVYYFETIKEIENTY